MSAKAFFSVGDRFGELVITGRAPTVAGSGGCWVFAKCDCGYEKRYPLRRLKRGDAKSCGTKQHFDRHVLERGESCIGRRFGLLTVVAATVERGTGRKAQVRVRCDCGAERFVEILSLERGAVSTCGGDAHRSIPKQAKRWEIHGKRMTYAIEAVGTGLVKIGRAREFRDRMIKMQFVCPVELRMFACSEDDIETRLHVMLDAHRAHGEWFYANEDVMSAIKQNMKPASLSVLRGLGRSGRELGRRAICKRCGAEGHYQKTCQVFFGTAPQVQETIDEVASVRNP